MKIWRMGYFPFTMGGSLYRPIAAELPDEQLGELYDLGLGFSGYLITDSNDQTHVIESLSGAHVGDTLDEVRQDIATSCDLEFMRDQVMDAIQKRDSATMIELETFWRKVH